jgi:hypothetical protein
VNGGFFNKLLIGHYKKNCSPPVYFNVLRTSMENPSATPPQTIMLNDSALLCHAVLDESVGYTVGHGLFFVDGKEIGKVPRLAICKDKASGLFTLYYCDKDWNPLGVATNYQSVDAAKHRAERIYPGSSTRWIDSRSNVR